MCMAMAPPERRECVPTSSGANMSLAAPNDGCADRAETLRGRVVADCGGRITSMFIQAEEDVDAHPKWAG